MKQRHARGLRRDEDAISVVVGAVLITALIFSTLLTVRLNFVPGWDKDAEADQMAAVANQMGGIVSLLAQQANNASQSSLVAPVSLAHPRASILSGSTASHDLRTRAVAQSVLLNTTRMLILRQNGSSAVGASEDFTNISPSSTLVNASQVQSLRIKIETVDRQDTGKNASVTIRDASGNFAGDLTVYVQEAGSSSYLVKARTRNAARVILFDQGVSTFDNNFNPTPYWMDALQDEVRFGPVVRGAAQPLTIDLRSNGWTASYAVTYVQSGPGGSVLVGGAGGQLRIPYASSNAGGVLEFHSRNSQFVQQDYIIDQGALVLNQSGRAVFKVPPSFHVSLVGNTTKVQLLLPTLAVDSNRTLSSSSTAAVALNTVTSQSTDGTAPRLRFDVRTAFPQLWRNYFISELSNVPGFQNNTHYTVASSATSATVEIFGAQPTRSSFYHDISVEYRQATIRLSISG